MSNEKKESLNQTDNEVIDRLINENSQLNRTIAEAKYEMSGIGSIDGLSFIGAVKALVKRNNDQEKLIWELKEQLSKALKDKEKR